MVFKMKNFSNLKQLLFAWQELPIPGRLYIEVRGDIENAQFWAVSSKEAKNQLMIETEFGRVPEILMNFHVKSFLDTQIFQDIVSLRLEGGTELQDYKSVIQAIYYYLECDDFMHWFRVCHPRRAGNLFFPICNTSVYFRAIQALCVIARIWIQSLFNL